MVSARDHVSSQLARAVTPVSSDGGTPDRGVPGTIRTHCGLAISGTQEVLGQPRVTADRRQLGQLLAFAHTVADAGVGGGERQRLGT